MFDFLFDLTNATEAFLNPGFKFAIQIHDGFGDILKVMKSGDLGQLQPSLQHEK